MKKFVIKVDGETFSLYAGIDAVSGGWLLETNGGATCQNELEDAGAVDTLEAIERLLADQSTPWEDCDEQDVEYINSTLEAWGLK